MTKSQQLTHALLCTLLAATTPVILKLALNLHWPPYILGLMRVSFIAIFFYILLRQSSLPVLGSSKRQIKYSVASSALKGIALTLLYYSLSLIPASRWAILATSSPIINFIFVQYFLENEQVSRRRFWGAGISLIGVILLLLTRNSAGTMQYNFWGDLSCLLSIISLNYMTVIEKKALNLGLSPAQLSASNNLGPILVFTIICFLTKSDPATIPSSPYAWLCFFYMITFTGVLFFYYRRWLASQLQISYLSSFSHFGKAMSIVLAVLVLDETLPVSSLGCFIIILIGTIVAAKGKHQPLNTLAKQGAHQTNN